MDWKLSKSIYITVFLIINIVLLIVLYNQYNIQERHESSRSQSISKSADYKTNVDALKNIKLSVLNGMQHEFQSETSMDQSGITQNVFEVKDLELDATIVKAHIDKEIYRGSEYTFDSESSTSDTIYYNQMYDSLPIFNNSVARIKVVKESGGALRFEQGYISNISVNEYSKQVQVSDPIKLAEELAKEKVISKEAVLKSSTLGHYVILLNDEEQQVLLRPKWKLVIEEDDRTRIIYVDAINASEEIIEGE
ncbi:two-component system regulatory protein YycI [Nosocomiicoccus ampullae]|uniref:two-component system regulatory protein YycI n=1 Tax=Nosocomiicoccus ampullae TaxID=489910 RepID=UPI00254D2D18|nr:two-component system regulatory protein YycI [Nosocomiicoccus ampullae]MDK6862861.1 two-component system regulatory protein YycI [Nosocomiicoccus ampullae]